MPCGDRSCMAGGLDKVSPPERLLVIGELDDQGHLEGFLQVLCEHEGDEVAQMQCF